jgi:uncharacterized protein
MNMRIIDFHAHVFPAKVAERATRAIGEFYDAPMAYKGSVDELISSGDAIGVERYIVHSTATRADQVISINDFIIAETERERRFVGYGTMHRDFASFEEEIDRVSKAGLRGIKLHPDFQKFPVDDPKMDDIYEAIAARNLPVLVHAGDRRYDFSGPRRVARVLDRHPRLTVIAAHFGGYTEWEDAFSLLAGRNLYMDTSSTLWKLDPARAIAILRKHGTDKFLFGSDFPMWDHRTELARILALGLTDGENRAILGENAARLLGE